MLDARHPKTQIKLCTIEMLPPGTNAGEVRASGHAWELAYQILPHVVVVQELNSGLQAHCILASSKCPGPGSPLVLQPEQATEPSGLSDTGGLWRSAVIRSQTCEMQRRGEMGFAAAALKMLPTSAAGCSVPSWMMEEVLPEPPCNQVKPVGSLGTRSHATGQLRLSTMQRQQVRRAALEQVKSEHVRLKPDLRILMGRQMPARLQHGSWPWDVWPHRMSACKAGCCTYASASIQQ